MIFCEIIECDIGLIIDIELVHEFIDEIFELIDRFH